MTRTEQPHDPVLAPIDVGHFFDTWWERQPLHIERADTDHFANLLSTAHVERLLSSRTMHFPDAQLTQAPEPVAPNAYIDSDNRILPIRFLGLHHSGATIVISQAQRYIAELDLLCKAMQSVLRMPCQTNLYLSPPARQGFNAHYDAHDVFILQVSGSKVFRFYKGGPELPLRHQIFDSTNCACGDLTEEIALSAGDTLYIPRGVMHDAESRGDVASLHVTLGVFPTTVVDVLHEALRLASRGDVTLRRAIIERPMSADETPSTFTRSMADARPGEQFTHRLLDEAIGNLRDDQAVDLPPDCRGLLARLDAARRLTPGTSVTVRQGVCLGLERREDVTILRTPGQTVFLDHVTGLAIESLVAAGPLRIDELPGLTNDDALALCRQLFDENVLTCVNLDTGRLDVD